LGFEKSQRSVTHDSLCYINILTYLHKVMLTGTCIRVCSGSSRVVFCQILTIVSSWNYFRLLV